ncbi:hypothetical protein [Actinomadura parmotrematis]|uniref:Uncharacterized protein n=1 Tax=Actinomadura parmotrematis TaxID=2864039 RepID=A0ABS7FVS6_9ACTN|nr:hypothetical protein [Actinomadura parmotrematis]MBW8484529.1 hypothetical protein [Actinomadura parmotrematis]
MTSALAHLTDPAHPIAIKLLAAGLVAALATAVALAAGIVSRFAKASLPQAAICAGTAFGGTATILLLAISTFNPF